MKLIDFCKTNLKLGRTIYSKALEKCNFFISHRGLKLKNAIIDVVYRDPILPEPIEIAKNVSILNT